TTRQRTAPSAVRIAISFSRSAARASNRLATFAHAINNTHPTAPSRIRIAGPADMNRETAPRDRAWQYPVLPAPGQVSLRVLALQERCSFHRLVRSNPSVRIATRRGDPVAVPRQLSA